MCSLGYSVVCLPVSNWCTMNVFIQSNRENVELLPQSTSIRLESSFIFILAFRFYKFAQFVSRKSFENEWHLASCNGEAGIRPDCRLLWHPCYAVYTSLRRRPRARFAYSAKTSSGGKTLLKHKTCFQLVLFVCFLEQSHRFLIIMINKHNGGAASSLCHIDAATIWAK